MSTHTRIWVSLIAMFCLGQAILLSSGCDNGGGGGIEDDIDDITNTVVTGRVTDNRGLPVANATIQLFDLTDNTHFVEGSDILSAEAYIDRKAILASDNTVATAQSGADGSFRISTGPTAFLAVATRDGCTADFAGFDEETGVLNLDTVIVPDLGLDFDIPDFVVACATPPEVGPDGNSDDAPPFEPPPPDIACDAAACEAAGGTCQDETCVGACAADSCAASGGTCEGGDCVLPTCNAAACADLGGTCEDDDCVLPPACDPTACATAGGLCDGDVCEAPGCDPTDCAEAQGTCSQDGNTCDIPPCLAAEADCEAAQGTCSADGTTCDIPPCLAAEADCTAAGGTCSTDGETCELPACSSDADCESAQPGAYCTDPGDPELAACQPPLPGEIVPPEEATGWTSFRITDLGDVTLADASEGNQVIAAADIPLDGLVRVYGEYTGSATTAYIQVQNGSQSCPDLSPRTDFIAVDLVGGSLASGNGTYVELFLHGGYQKISLSTSDTLGEGDRSFAVEVGDACAPPQHAFIAILTWSAGPSQPADLDLNVWNAAGDLVFIGRKDAAWGQLVREGRDGPGPEVFWGDDGSEGPFTIKVQFFSGRPRDIEAKVRIIRMVAGEVRDDTYVFTVRRPKDVAEIGVFAAD